MRKEKDVFLQQFLRFLFVHGKTQTHTMNLNVKECVLKCS